jgi:predicted nucleic acid-binding protein
MMADSSAWIDFLRATGSHANRRLRDALTRRETVWMPDAVYQEVLQGAANPAQFVQLQSLLDAATPWQADDGQETARYAALLYARCRWRGITIRSPNDCLIAACAIEAGEPLLHADRDFERIATIEPKLTFA